MFTPGIEALSRLGCQANGVEFLIAISDANNLPRFTHKELLVTGSVAAKVPVEVWARIGGFITSPADLVTLASISARAMSAAGDLARFPLVKELRLVDVVASCPVLSIPETKEITDDETAESADDESADDEDILRYFYELGCAKFTAVRSGRRNISFEVQTYLSGPVVIKNNELYISELDDDKAS